MIRKSLQQLVIIICLCTSVFYAWEYRLRAGPGVYGNTRTMLIRPVSNESIGNVLDASVFIEVDGKFTACGSGVIVSPDGLIMTAAHVTDGAKKITVTLNNGKEYEATAVWKRLNGVDLSLIKIKAKNLPVVRISETNSRIGDAVFVIGSPFGEGQFNSVTTGIISGLGRDVPLFADEPIMLQTDAAINPGNSGGGLFNAGGDLIGIVVGVIIEGNGMGLCIPSIACKELVDHYTSKNK